MEKESIITLAEQYITELLNTGLTNDHLFHNLGHTLSVRDACLEMANQLGLTWEEKEILELSVLFHDTGYTQKYIGHEKVSMDFAKQFLVGQEYPKNKLDKVLACIEATIMTRQPENLLQQLIRMQTLVTSVAPTFLNY